MCSKIQSTSVFGNIYGGHYPMRPIQSLSIYSSINSKRLQIWDDSNLKVVSFWCHFLLWWCCAHLGPAWDKFVENPVWCRVSGRDGVYRRTCQKQTSLTFNFFIQHIRCICMLYITQQINRAAQVPITAVCCITLSPEWSTADQPPFSCTQEQICCLMKPIENGNEKLKIIM